MYGGGGYDYGRGNGAGGAFPRRSYPPTAQDEPPYFHQQQQTPNFGPSGNWGSQQLVQQRQAAAGGPSPRLEGLLGELRELVAQRGRLSPNSVNTINRATEAVAAQRRSGGFQSPYHLQQAERSIEAIRQAAEQRMAERQRQEQQQQAIYQHRDSGQWPQR